MANPTTSTKDYGHSAVEKTKEAAAHVGEKAREAASAVGDKAREAASAVGDLVSSTASNIGTNVSKTAERMTTATGTSVRHLGDTIKEKGPQEGVLGGATRAVAGSLQEGGKYLEQEGFSGMMEDVTELIRRNPVPAILVGVGIGFLIGRTLGSS